jgi:hypothetical protein
MDTNVLRFFSNIMTDFFSQKGMFFEDLNDIKNIDKDNIQIYKVLQ